jgi:hypothetical protein
MTTPTGTEQESGRRAETGAGRSRPKPRAESSRPRSCVKERVKPAHPALPIRLPQQACSSSLRSKTVGSASAVVITSSSRR